MAASGSKSLKEYLKRYESNSGKDDKKKKKKSKKQKSKPVSNGVLIMDQDPVWQKPVFIEEDNDPDSADEEKPIVDEDIEVKRMKRLEQIRARMAQNAVSEDGSGWVSLSPKRSDFNTPNSDLSPPRRRVARNDTPSPERNLEALGSREDGDLSPPRQSRRRQRPSPSPDRDEDGGVDLSPPRKRKQSPPPRQLEDDSDLSPPRKSRSEDLSPPQKSKKSNPDSDKEQRKTGLITGRDLSPPRKSKKQNSDSDKEQRKTGLITGREMTEEIERTKKQDMLRFQEMDPSISGRNAEPIYRDKLRGERITKEEYLKSRQKVEEKPKEIKVEWGKGLAQKREAEAKLQELELEKDKPFARSRDDPDIDIRLKEAVRWGDPMAHLVKKKQPELELPNFGDNEKMKESGFVIPQDVPKHSWIKRGLDAPPNRYGIKPGRHWDGVDRSTGYERELFKRKNEKQASEKEAYLWSVSDM